MPRTNHFPVQAKIPIYSVGFLSDDVVVYCGGGGAGRSGVNNAIVTARVSIQDRTLISLDELPLSRQEDAPMSMAVNPLKQQLVCGINSPADQVKKGENSALRIFDWSVSQSNIEETQIEDSSNDSGSGNEKKAEINEKQQGDDTNANPEKDTNEQENRPTIQSMEAKVSFNRSAQSLHITDPEHYVKVSAFSPNGRLLAVGSTDGQVALHRFPSLAPVWSTPTSSSGSNGSSNNVNKSTSDSDMAAPSLGDPSTDFADTELNDVDFSEPSSHIVFTSSSKLVIYSTTPFAADNDDNDSNNRSSNGRAQLIQTIKNPALGGKAGSCSFRSARFGRCITRNRLFTIVNASMNPGKSKVRKSFVTAWDADSWELIETRHISDRPVTVFDVSPNGQRLAIGSSDLSITLLDATSLRPILKILSAHDFPPTALRFSPNSQVLISASADTSLRLIPVPDSLPNSSINNPLVGFFFPSWSSSSSPLSPVYLTIFLAFLTTALALYFQHRLSPV